MFRKLMLHTAMLCSIFILTACGGGGSGASGSAEEISVKTTIEMDGSRSSRAASDVIVTMTLPDGTTVQMTSTGNGNEYACTVSYTEGDPVYIRAVYGDLVLKNFFDSIDVSGASADLGATTPLTTLFVDVLESMVEAMDSSVPAFDIIGYLLEGVKEATLAIDVTTVKAEVTDTGNTTYTTLQQAYQAAITWDNDGNASAYQTAMNEVVSTIEAGGIEIPVSEFEDTIIETMAHAVAQAFAGGDISALTAIVYSENFLDDGYDAETTIADLESEFSSFGPYITLNLVSDSATAEKMTPDDPAYASLSSSGVLMYRLYMNHHIQAKLGSTVVYEEAYDDVKGNETGMVLQKIGSSWYLRGNRNKAEYWATMHDDENWASRYIYADICEGGTDITTASLTSPGFTGTANLARNPYETECLSVQIFENGQVWGWDGTTFEQLGTVVLNGANLCGTSITYSVTFAGGSTETKTVTIPSCTNKTVTLSAAKNGDDSVTVTYSFPNDADTSECDINIGRRPSGGGVETEIEKKDNIPFGSTSYTFDSSTFSAGYTYTFRLHFTDKYRRQYTSVADEVTF